MCLCCGIGEAALVVAGAVIVKKKLKLKMPTLAELASKRRAGIKPGQVFKDKRRKARVNEKVEVKRDAETDG